MLCEVHNTEMVLRKNGASKKLKAVCLKCGAERAARRYAADPRPTMLYHAKQRAIKAGVPFTITKEDIVIPTHCPVLGVELKHNGTLEEMLAVAAWMQSVIPTT